MWHRSGKAPFKTLHIFGTADPGVTLLMFNQISFMYLGAWFVIECGVWGEPESYGPFKSEAEAIDTITHIRREISTMMEEIKKGGGDYAVD